MEREITESAPLLDGDGNLTQSGWARKQLPVYQRTAVKGGALRRKEWDSYLVMNDRVALTLTVSDCACMGQDTISLLDLQTGWQGTKSPLRIVPIGCAAMPQSSGEGHTAGSGRGYSIFFRNSKRGRLLVAHMDNFAHGADLDVQIALTEEPQESMVLCTPFPKAGQFHYGQAIHCMRATGRVTLGDKVYEFQPQDSFGSLDWGRSVWPRHTVCYRASAAGLVGGVPVGVSIGYGLGGADAATENIIFYNGIGHKLTPVGIHRPKGGGDAPWLIADDDGRLELTFCPVVDRVTCTGVVALQSKEHWVFGQFSGRCVLEDGRVLEIQNFMGTVRRIEGGL